jgi:hypothetical protein
MPGCVLVHALAAVCVAIRARVDATTRERATTTRDDDATDRLTTTRGAATRAVLDDHSALCMYIKAGDAPWEYCGCVANAKPSDVFTLRWPMDEATGRAHSTAAVGVSVEPLASALEKEAALIQH